MAVITLPSNLRVRQQDIGQRRFDLMFGSGDTGAQQARILAPPRWFCALVGEEKSDPAAAAVWRQLILSLEGRINQLAVYDLLNPAPRGTARGTWVVGTGGAAAGTSSMPIDCLAAQAGKTILTGDWIGCGQASSGAARQLLHVQGDVTLDGAGKGTVTFKAPLRVALAAGAALAWDKPTCLMKQTGNESSWSSTGYQPRQSGFSLDLQESWE
jgi:hypothetical protein